MPVAIIPQPVTPYTHIPTLHGFELIRVSIHPYRYNAKSVVMDIPAAATTFSLFDVPRVERRYKQFVLITLSVAL